MWQIGMYKIGSGQQYISLQGDCGFDSYGTSSFRSAHLHLWWLGNAFILQPLLFSLNYCETFICTADLHLEQI